MVDRDGRGIPRGEINALETKLCSKGGPYA